MKRPLTDRERRAKANVAPEQLVATHEGKAQQPFAEPVLVVECIPPEPQWFWTFTTAAGDECTSKRTFPTAQEATSHGRRLMGVAWNMPVTVKGGSHE